MADIMTIRPPDSLKKALKDAAISQGITLNALVVHVLWEWVEKHNEMQHATQRNSKKNNHAVNTASSEKNCV